MSYVPSDVIESHTAQAWQKRKNARNEGETAYWNWIIEGLHNEKKYANTVLRRQG